MYFSVLTLGRQLVCLHTQSAGTLLLCDWFAFSKHGFLWPMWLAGLGNGAVDEKAILTSNGAPKGPLKIFVYRNQSSVEGAMGAPLSTAPFVIRHLTERRLSSMRSLDYVVTLLIQMSCTFARHLAILAIDISLATLQSLEVFNVNLAIHALLHLAIIRKFHDKPLLYH